MKMTRVVKRSVVVKVLGFGSEGKVGLLSIVMGSNCSILKIILMTPL